MDTAENGNDHRMPSRLLAPIPESEARQRVLRLLAALCAESMENVLTLVECLHPINQLVPLVNWENDVSLTLDIENERKPVTEVTLSPFSLTVPLLSFSLSLFLCLSLFFSFSLFFL